MRDSEHYTQKARFSSTVEIYNESATLFNYCYVDLETWVEWCYDMIFGIFAPTSFTSR